MSIPQVNIGIIQQQIAPNVFLQLDDEIPVLVATDDVTITGLSYDENDNIKLVTDLTNTSGTNTSPLLYVNGNEVDSNYYSQRILVEAAIESGTRQNSPIVGLLDNGTKALLEIDIKKTSDDIVTYQSQGTIKYGGNDIGLVDYYSSTTFTVPGNITSLKLDTNTAGGKFSSGSYIWLYSVIDNREVANIDVLITATQVDISGLNFDENDLFEIEGTYINPTGNSSALQLFVNNDLTLTNYWRQRIQASAGTLSAARNNELRIIPSTAGTTSKFRADIKLTKDGKYVVMADTIRNIGGSSLDLHFRYATKITNESSINIINCVSQITNGLGSGTKIQLWEKPEANQKAEILVATTQIDITSLNVGKGNEVELVSDIVGNGAGGDLYLFVNNDLTLTNYDTQDVVATSTTIAGTRNNEPKIGFISGGIRGLFISTIKLANSGLTNIQSKEIREYGGSGIRIGKYYSSKTATVVTITQLTVQSSSVNGLGVGSEFYYRELI